MKLETWILGSGFFLFPPLGIVYGIFSEWEPVGVTGLLLTGGLSALIGAYLWVTARRIDPRPEDNPYAEQHEGDPEPGFFSPWSWWPLALGATIAVSFAGLAIGWWMFIIGAAFAALAVVGWTMEYSKGTHAH